MLSSKFEKYALKSSVAFLLTAIVMFGMSLTSSIVMFVMFIGVMFNVMFESPSINPGSSAVSTTSYCCPGIISFNLTHSPKHTSFE